LSFLDQLTRFAAVVTASSRPPYSVRKLRAYGLQKPIASQLTAHLSRSGPGGTCGRHSQKLGI